MFTSTRGCGTNGLMGKFSSAQYSAPSAISVSTPPPTPSQFLEPKNVDGRLTGGRGDGK